MHFFPASAIFLSSMDTRPGSIKCLLFPNDVSYRFMHSSLETNTSAPNFSQGIMLKR